MPKKRKRSRLLIGLLIAGISGFVLLVLVCGGVALLIRSLTTPTTFPQETESYAQARKGFQTVLVRKGPAPQAGQRPIPPAGVTEIAYKSGDLSLKAWVNAPNGKPAPK